MEFVPEEPVLNNGKVYLQAVKMVEETDKYLEDFKNKLEKKYNIKPVKEVYKA